MGKTRFERGRITTDDIVVEVGVIPPVPEATPNSEQFESRTEALPSIYRTNKTVSPGEQ